MNIVKYIKKLIKKQKLLKKYKKGPKEYSDQLWLSRTFNWSNEEKHYFSHQFLCELKCYNRIKKL